MSANYTELKSRISAINFFVRLLSNGNWEVTNCETGKTREFNHDLEYIVKNLEAIHARRAAEAVATAETETETETEVVETVATIETANLTNYDIVTMAEVNGFRVSLQANGEWHLIRKSDRQVTNIGYNLRDAVAIINPTPETMSQVEIERGYAAQEAEEHAAWVASQTEEEVNVIEDDDTMTVMMAAVVLCDRRTGDATEEEIDEAQGVMVRAVAAELRARGVGFADDSLQDWICAGEFRGWETAESLADEWGDSDEEEIDPDEARRAEYEVWAHKQWLNDMAAD